MPRRTLADFPGNAALGDSQPTPSRSSRSTKASAMQQDAPVTPSPTPAIDEAAIKEVESTGTAAPAHHTMSGLN